MSDPLGYFSFDFLAVVIGLDRKPERLHPQDAHKPAFEAMLDSKQ
ncbi:MAG: hypothetical protein ACKOA0_07185 [Burkholderiaceae bacterium]